MRKDLYGKDAAALQAAHDPMIDLARMIDAQAREARKIYNAQDEIKKQAYADIAKARFAIEGASSYPDATFTLRLSYGTVRGYEQDGKQIPAFTDFAGLYQRATEHDNRPPFDLPKRWLDKKSDLNLATKFDFVSDADIIGGNSGSPVVNKANEFVGIIFDGNIQSLVADCIYTDTQARAVSVDSAAIIEALRKVYDAQRARGLSWKARQGRDAALRRPDGAARRPYHGSAMKTYGQSSDSFDKTCTNRVRQEYNRPSRENSLPFVSDVRRNRAAIRSSNFWQSIPSIYLQSSAPAFPPRETKRLRAHGRALLTASRTYQIPFAFRYLIVSIRSGAIWSCAN